MISHVTNTSKETMNNFPNIQEEFKQHLNRHSHWLSTFEHKLQRCETLDMHTSHHSEERSIFVWISKRFIVWEINSETDRGIKSISMRVFELICSVKQGDSIIEVGEEHFIIK